MSTIFNYLKFLLLLILFIDNINAKPPPPTTPEVTYTNAQNTFSPSSFEACIGDTITLDYRNFSAQPEILRLTGNGNTLDISLASAHGYHITTASRHHGSISIAIPASAFTGNVKLLDTTNTTINTIPITTNSTLYDFNNNLIIHKPVVDFHLPQAPLCATDTIPLIGIPANGIFSSTLSNLIDNNSTIIGMNAGWTRTTNDSIKNISISYQYTPKYINGASCPNPISTSKTVQIRDNRLNSLDFEYIITRNAPTINDRVILHPDSLIVRNFAPDSLRNYPVSFSGNYVNQINGVNTFFTDYAGYSNTPISMQYDNGGCIGEFTATLAVLFPLQLSGLVDTLCNKADPIVLQRDTSHIYAYSKVTTIAPDPNFPSIRIRTTVESNIIDSVSTKNPNYRASIAVINSSPSQEEYTFDPESPVLNNAQTAIITMHYRASEITTERIDSRGTVLFSSTESARPSIIEYPITLVDRPILNFSLDSTYCKNAGAADSLTPSPIFEAPYSSFSYAARYTTSSPFSLATSLPNDTFDANYIYDQVVPFGNQDLLVKLIYTVERHGCTDSYIQHTKIIGPIAYSLHFDPPPVRTGYCNNANPIQLIPTYTTTSYTGIGEFLVDGVLNSPLIDSANFFLPDSAQNQDYNISYQFTDTTNCRSTSIVKVISIRAPSVIQLEIDGNSSNPKICSNTDHVLLKTRLLSGNYTNNVTYNSTNLSIVGDTLKPYDTYSNNGNQNVIQTITVNYNDSFSCVSSDDLLVEIYKPSPRMNGFIAASNNNIYTYCNNESPFSIIEIPNHSSTDTIIGAGVVLQNGIYSYRPSSVLVDSFVMDTVRYEYTDALGCSSLVETIVRIDSIPDLSLNGLNTSYCINNPAVQLRGLPLPTTANSSARFNGSGVNAAGIFSPTVAGSGQKNIIYSFEDGNGCENQISKTTTIHDLPISQFNFPQNQYCVSDTMLPLNQHSALGTYTFWGSIIDSTHILNPQDTTGQQTVFYALTDSLGCSDTNSTSILINPLPIITISGLDAAYCFNGSSSHILINPAPTSFLEISGSAPGFNINSAGVTFNPGHDSTGIKPFTYTYADNVTNCSNSIVLNTAVYPVPTLSATGINTTYCAIDSLYPIMGIPSGGEFSGSGISSTGTQFHFNPASIGGVNRILNYSINHPILYNASDTLFCPVDTNIQIIVNPLPPLSFNGPGDNVAFCSNDTNTALIGLAQTKTWHLFTSPSAGAIDTTISIEDIPTGPNTFRRESDTSYFFSPLGAGPGRHHITYTATDSATGCQDSMSRSYYVTDYGLGASFSLNSSYCASTDSIHLSGTPPSGHFLRNQTALAPPYYLTLNTPTSQTDTIIYTVSYDACISSDTQIVTIDSLVDLSFEGNSLSKTYCKGNDDSPLSPNISGGMFNGSAVISRDSLFSLQLANIGANIITYTLIDPNNSCTSTVEDTFFVYTMPKVNFKTLGGCQFDPVFFQPDNSSLNLGLRDNITNIRWQLDTATFVNGSSPSHNKIDSIDYTFNTPGIYYTKLTIANQTHCVDSSTVRVVISPTITSNQFPYDETFQNSSGNWYAEAKDSSHNLLWKWGADSIIDPNNNVWGTNLSRQYTANEAAWVYSPCFDISALERPMIRFKHYSDSRSSGDGTVLEFQNTDGTWSPLGEVGRGINWFNANFIAGAPGNQPLAPIGWSGEDKKWVNSRYKLDEFKNTLPSKLRLRMAFGASSIDLTNFHSGFAFDDVWIGNRTRNVLLETTSNINEQDMDYINNYVYQLVYHSPINKDVILLQYHSEISNQSDEFHLFNPAVANSRTLFYGIFNAGRAFINGITHTHSDSLNDLHFEKSMLESPKFNVEIDTFYHTNPSRFILETTVTALENIPDTQRYRINMVITEDSLSYSSGEKVHAVVRKDYPSNSINTFDKSWVIGEQVTLSHTYPATDLNYVPNHFQAVVFIQAQLDSAREIFQAATTRDINGYWVGVDQVASEKELNEIKDMNLYPNPARDYINIDFPEILEKDYNWKLVSIGGVTIKEDVIHAGEQSLKIDNYDLPSGVYIFMAYNDNVYSQRKVIINKD